jgi:hypothetical protein
MIGFRLRRGSQCCGGKDIVNRTVPRDMARAIGAPGQRNAAEAISVIIFHACKSLIRRRTSILTEGKRRLRVRAMSDPPVQSPASNVGKWDGWYRNLSVANQGPIMYANAATYLIAAAFLADVDEVEDWGCGGGGFRRFCLSPRYIGLDGSRTPFADKIVDLCTHSSNAPGIMMRHILEHNYEWEKILVSAVRSFQEKYCLILFTPFASETKEIAHNRKYGVDVPDISFKRQDIERHFDGLKWKLIENITTQSQYNVEHVYFVWR